MDGGEERRLNRAAQRGSAPAAEELTRRHAHSAWRSAFALTRSRDLADEVSQAAMARAFRSLGGFDARRPFAPLAAPHRAQLRA